MCTHTASSYCSLSRICMGLTLIFGQLLSSSTLQATAGVIDFQSSDINLRLLRMYSHRRRRHLHPPTTSTQPPSSLIQAQARRKRREDTGEIHPPDRCADATVHREELEGKNNGGGRRRARGRVKRGGREGCREGKNG